MKIDFFLAFVNYQMKKSVTLNPQIYLTSIRNMQWDKKNVSRWIFLKLADDDV